MTLRMSIVLLLVCKVITLLLKSSVYSRPLCCDIMTYVPEVSVLRPGGGPSSESAVEFQKPSVSYDASPDFALAREQISRSTEFSVLGELFLYVVVPVAGGGVCHSHMGFQHTKR